MPLKKQNKKKNLGPCYAETTPPRLSASNTKTCLATTTATLHTLYKPCTGPHEKTYVFNYTKLIWSAFYVGV